MFTMLLFMVSGAWASTAYDMSMEVKIDGKTVTSPRIVGRAGEQSAITTTDGDKITHIEVTADEGQVNGQPGILMKFLISYVENGRTVISRPTILARENEKAEIHVGAKGLSPALSMTVKAQRKSM